MGLFELTLRLTEGYFSVTIWLLLELLNYYFSVTLCYLAFLDTLWLLWGTLELLLGFFGVNLKFKFHLGNFGVILRLCLRNFGIP